MSIVGRGLAPAVKVTEHLCKFSAKGYHFALNQHLNYVSQRREQAPALRHHCYCLHR